VPVQTLTEHGLNRECRWVSQMETRGGWKTRDLYVPELHCRSQRSRHPGIGPARFGPLDSGNRVCSLSSWRALSPIIQGGSKRAHAAALCGAISDGRPYRDRNRTRKTSRTPPALRPRWSGAEPTAPPACSRPTVNRAPRGRATTETVGTGRRCIGAYGLRIESQLALSHKTLSA
jgi:hypothetical protein